VTAPPQQSAATGAFDDAIALLHQLEIADPAASPPLSWRPPAGDASAAVGAPAWLGPGSAASRPGLDARSLTDAPTLAEARRQLRAGTTSVLELVDASLAAAAADPHGAMVAIDQDQVRGEAAARDAELAAGTAVGPLHGIPITVKDIIHVAGLPTAAGSSIYLEHPAHDAAAVAMLREAGAVIVGKAATHEFALGVTTPQCTNPFDPSRISGGSSGGSAIGVATGIGLASLGTDTRASLRVPASFCGVVGFKPTYGCVPTAGIVPLSWTLDHIGPIAATVDDAAIVLDVLMPGASIAQADASPSGLVVGIAADALREADAEVAEVVESALVALERIGCKVVVVDVPQPDDLSLANAVGLLISRSEAAAFHRAVGHDIEGCIPEVRDQLLAGLCITAVDYLDAQRAREGLAARALAVFGSCDVVVTPTTPVVAPPRAEYERFLMRLSRNTLVWGLAGSPALSMPCGLTAEGLPVGLQLAGRPYEEHVLASIGRHLERELASGW
jgi:aspartyl-tRNA(Asn)/glutamyl-tRNA(Gln) amidotransferase subunit A